MSAARKTICRDHHKMLGPYLDGELDPATLMDIEDHVGACEPCREQVALLRAMRGTLKRVVKAAPPAGMRDRMLRAMQAEAARAPAPEPKPADRFFSLRNVVPVAAAAAFALVWGATANGPAVSREARVSADDMLADLVAEHSHPLPLDQTNPSAARNLEKYVGVPVHPARVEKTGAVFVGHRVLPLHQQRAAMLEYVVGGGDDARRVSVLVYDPQRIQVHGPELTPRAIGTARVQVGTVKGYSVAVAERNGVGYAIASDLDADRSAQLAVAAANEGD